MQTFNLHKYAVLCEVIVDDLVILMEPSNIVF